MSFEVAISCRTGDFRLNTHWTSDARLTALVGPSGAGKTTTLDCIAGLRRPDGGRITVAGETVFDTQGRIDLPTERRRAGYVFQNNRLFPHRDVRANLTYGEKLAPAGAHWLGLEEAVDLLGIGALLERRIGTLSGGEARRVAIGRALLSAPRFLLLDEPLTSLDRPRAEEILRLIERIRDTLAIPILLVSHDEADVARLADTVIRMG